MKTASILSLVLLFTFSAHAEFEGPHGDSGGSFGHGHRPIEKSPFDIGASESDLIYYGVIPDAQELLKSVQAFKNDPANDKAMGARIRNTDTLRMAEEILANPKALNAILAVHPKDSATGKGFEVMLKRIAKIDLLNATQQLLTKQQVCFDPSTYGQQINKIVEDTANATQKKFEQVALIEAYGSRGLAGTLLMDAQNKTVKGEIEDGSRMALSHYQIQAKQANQRFVKGELEKLQRQCMSPTPDEQKQRALNATKKLFDDFGKIQTEKEQLDMLLRNLKDPYEYQALSEVARGNKNVRKVLEKAYDRSKTDQLFRGEKVDQYDAFLHKEILKGTKSFNRLLRANSPADNYIEIDPKYIEGRKRELEQRQHEKNQLEMRNPERLLKELNKKEKLSRDENPTSPSVSPALSSPQRPAPIAQEPQPEPIQQTPPGFLPPLRPIRTGGPN